MSLKQTTHQDEASEVFSKAAELFALMSSPMRLRILSSLCDTELSVSQLLERIETTQPNLSQHLALLTQAGVLAKRKEGTTVFYSVLSQKAVQLCRSVCTQVAIELDEPAGLVDSERLLVRV